MTVDQFLREATGQLKTAAIETARLDVLVLLEDELGSDRAHLLAHPDRPIPARKLAKLNTKITQRYNHTPVAYIRGRTAFYGRDFIVNKRVLVPRPESEAMIDLLKNIPLPQHPRIADIGTGSGCLGLTAALEIPNAELELYDIAAGALQVARRNARQFGVQPICKKADLLQGINSHHYDVLLANLPYVPENYPINPAAQFEPKQALFAGTDGLEAYRRFWAQVQTLPHPPQHIITEAFPAQHADMRALAKSTGYAERKLQGFAQYFGR